MMGRTSPRIAAAAHRTRTLRCCGPARPDSASSAWRGAGGAYSGMERQLASRTRRSSPTAGRWSNWANYYTPARSCCDLVSVTNSGAVRGALDERPRRGHLVRGEAHARDRRRFLGVARRRHVHAGAAVEFDSIALAAADQFRQRAAFVAGREVDERDLDGAVGLGEFQRARELKLRPAARVLADQERANDLVDFACRAFVGRAGGVADEAVVGLDANDHGVAFENRALAAMERAAASARGAGTTSGGRRRW